MPSYQLIIHIIDILLAGLKWLGRVELQGDYFLTNILFSGAWLISLFEFKIDDGCNFEIRTASSTCLVRGSLKTDVMENCHLLGSFGWWLVWCLCRGLKSLFLFNFLMCSMNLTLAGLPVSPSYDDSLPWSLQFMDIILYPTRPETEPEYPAGYRIHLKSGSGWAGTGMVFFKVPDSVNRNRKHDQNSGSYRNSTRFSSKTWHSKSPIQSMHV